MRRDVPWLHEAVPAGELTHAASGEAAAAPVVLDLRGVRCPLAWARAKVWLETLARGTAADVLVDDPRSVRDLPRAAEANGHHVVAVTEEPALWRVTLEV
jgi:sulfite reductase (NADPH) hemoprotein beta-component/sulfite reductase (ferredoxin)